MAGFAEVSEVLWRERELLDVLLYKLDQERLLVADGNVRWLARAAREIDLVLEEVRLTELTRAMEIDALAGDLGLPAAPSLADLVSVAPSPWSELFRAHRSAFLELTEEIRKLARANESALDAAWQAAQETLITLGAS